MKFGSAFVAAYLGMAIGLLACQPLYGGRPERLHGLDQKKRPPDQAPTETQVMYVDECTASFQDDPRKARPQATVSRQLTDAGDVAIASSDRAQQPESKVGLVREAIDKYRNALLKDPYNSDATLKLAVAYDKVLRKGCALAMLRRLASLGANPKIAPEALRQLDAVSDNSQWFKGYRKDAMTAIGR